MRYLHFFLPALVIGLLIVPLTVLATNESETETSTNYVLESTNEGEFIVSNAFLIPFLVSLLLFMLVYFFLRRA